MSGVHPPAPHDALGDFALPLAFGEGAGAPRTGCASPFDAVSSGFFAGSARSGAGGAASAVASGATVAGGVAAAGGAGGAAAAVASGAAVARSALLQPSDVPAPRTASAVTNVSTVSEGLRIPAC